MGVTRRGFVRCQIWDVEEGDPEGNKNRRKVGEGKKKPVCERLGKRFIPGISPRQHPGVFRENCTLIPVLSRDIDLSLPNLTSPPLITHDLLTKRERERAQKHQTKTTVAKIRFLSLPPSLSLSRHKFHLPLAKDFLGRNVLLLSPLYKTVVDNNIQKVKVPARPSPMSK